MLQQVYAEFVKKFTLWRRRPIWLIIGVVAPIGLSIFVIAAFASASALPVWGIGLVDEDDTAESVALREAIVAQEGTFPYYGAVAEDREEAERLFSRGEVYMMVVIPEGFGDSLRAGTPKPVQAVISNAHADLTKNLRLGLDARLYLYYEEYMLPATDVPGVVYDYTLTYPVEIPRTGYMAVGVLVLTIILTCMMYGGLFAALEHEEKTAPEIEMPPRGGVASMVGSVLAVVAEMFIVLVVVGVINGLLWHLQMPSPAAAAYSLIAAVLLGVTFALLGYGLGNKAKDVRLVLGPTMITVLGLWLLAGGINPIEAMAGTEYLGLLPTAAAVRIMANGMVGLETISMGANLVIVCIWAAAVVATALLLKMGILRRARARLLARLASPRRA
ncbi:MAG: ABC transporter permease [Chloroflexota bacterium]|nr:ABC transporter permease [Chloroflexota bacterium]